MKEKTRNTGLKIKTLPKDTCKDINCPFHGSLRLRGRSFLGTVIATNMNKTATIRWERRHYIPKYERHEKRITKIKAHDPGCIHVHEGDLVRLKECRPLSKTKNFVIVENLGKVKGYEERAEALEESRYKKKDEEESSDEPKDKVDTKENPEPKEKDEE